MDKLTPADLRAVLAALGLTQAALASALGVNPRTVQRWADGDRAVPEPVRRVLTIAMADPGLMERMRVA